MITVFGSINVDLVFALPTLPAPGETVLCPGYHATPGGKGLNQAVAIARAQAPDTRDVRIVGCTGDDGFAKLARESLADAGVKIDSVATVATPTGCAAVQVDAAGENQIAVASGANGTVTADQLDDAWLGCADVLVMQMEVPLIANTTAIARAHARGTRILLNLAPAGALPPDAIRALDLLVLNEIEATMIARTAGLADAEGAEAARALAHRFDVTTVVSLGRLGARAFRGTEGWAVDALKIEPVDTVGAGDAFVGSLAIGLERDLALPAMLHRASVAGGLACLAPGGAASAPDMAAIEANLSRLAPPKRIVAGQP